MLSLRIELNFNVGELIFKQILHHTDTNVQHGMRIAFGYGTEQPLNSSRIPIEFWWCQKRIKSNRVEQKTMTHIKFNKQNDWRRQINHGRTNKNDRRPNEKIYKQIQKGFWKWRERSKNKGSKNKINFYSRTCKWNTLFIYMHTHTHRYIVYVYAAVCLCVCVNDCMHTTPITVPMLRNRLSAYSTISEKINV